MAFDSNKIITTLLKSVGHLSRSLTISQRGSLGRFMGKVLKSASKKRYRITFNNIAQAFPEKHTQWHQETALKSYENLGITLVELLAFPDLNDEIVAKYIRYDNVELLEELHARGHGLLLLSGHYGNWELLAYSAGLFSRLPISIIVKPQQNRYADELLNRYRTQRGNRVIPMGQAARAIIQALKNGEAVALLADQSATSDKDIFVDFFGRPAATYEAPAALALRFKTPIVIGFAKRQEDGTYRVRLSEIPHEDLQNTPEGIRELTRRHVRALENAIRERPELWSWQHRRWKHQPK
ncbi:MAG TPA: lysophospholipid acyltransferase family protein [Patescibacteria group bacterium]|nr:lysophospholipid acyltransferase family protein [Patescibacteria group bacterium]